MSIKKVGWCRNSQELVLDVQILNIPYLRDDMDVYANNGRVWSIWTPETQGYCAIQKENIPEVVMMAMMMLS